MTATTQPPPLMWSLTEGMRSAAELAWFVSARPWLAQSAQGDGRGVLVIPGLMADDSSTANLRSLLRSVGYRTYGWKLGTDVGPTARAIEGLDARLAHICERTGGRPVSVIGQSLGGILGMELARRNPDKVDRLISLGSPVSISSPMQSRAGRVYDMFAGRHLPEYDFERWVAAPKPDVASSSIYSHADGVVAIDACRYEPGPRTENIRVSSSHLGMGVNPAAVYATLDRLAAPLDAWQPFSPPAHLRVYYPEIRRASAGAAA